MAEKKKYNSILVSGRKDQTLTYSKYVKDEESGESVKESLDKKVNVTDELETQQIKDGAITNEKMASNCVTSDKIQPGAVKHDHLTEDCISTGNIRDGSVTAKKLGTDIYKDISNRVTDIVTKDFPPAITEEQITDITSK